MFTRLNFDVSNLTDIKGRTIATTASYMKEIIKGKITRPNFFLSNKFFQFYKNFLLLQFYELNLRIFILVRPESFSSRV
jgi:hypothetical protein